MFPHPPEHEKKTGILIDNKLWYIRDYGTAAIILGKLCTGRYLHRKKKAFYKHCIVRRLALSSTGKTVTSAGMTSILGSTLNGLKKHVAPQIITFF